MIGNLVAVVLLAAEAHLQLLDGVLPGNVYTWAAFVLPILNAAFRLRHAYLQTSSKTHDGFH